MFFQQAPADTFGYMIFGFVVIFGTMLAYLVSMIVRNANFKRDIDLLDELEETEK